MVEFNFLEKATLRNRTRLKQFLVQMCKTEGFKLEALSIVFCSDNYLLEVNRSYLRHDYYTDIITFDYSESPKLVNGELFISIDRVRDNARSFQTTLERELLRVIFHGVLHLCGYGDTTKREVSIMRLKEEAYLRKYQKRST